MALAPFHAAALVHHDLWHHGILRRILPGRAAPLPRNGVDGRAGLVAGAMSMAAGGYVAVSAQSDTEQADPS